VEFEWDERNISYILSKEDRKITPSLVAEVSENDPLLVPETRGGRSGSHKMIAPANDGRYWTFVLLDKGNDVWRPITGWPSTNAEIRLYEETE
jgi:hypothetical protein